MGDNCHRNLEVGKACSLVAGGRGVGVGNLSGVGSGQDADSDCSSVGCHSVFPKVNALPGSKL